MAPVCVWSVYILYLEHTNINTNVNAMQCCNVMVVLFSKFQSSFLNAPLLSLRNVFCLRQYVFMAMMVIMILITIIMLACKLSHIKPFRISLELFVCFNVRPWLGACFTHVWTLLYLKACATSSAWQFSPITCATWTSWLKAAFSKTSCC